jgi:23S rRNA (adenine2503-C2)-methyltransferase
MPYLSIETDVLNLLALEPVHLEQVVRQLGWPPYRSRQILRWIYHRRARSIEDMTDLSRAERRQLGEVATIRRITECRALESGDGSRKFLMRLPDGLEVEAVLIPEGRRLTLCLSTQVGCTLDCRFCLTGQMGLKRNLKAHEIVDQVLTLQDRLAPAERITNIVLMGMGEPLANFEAVAQAVRRLTNVRWGVGIAGARITLSTAGLASRLQDVSRLGVNLAVSLNASTPAQRRDLMPAADRLHSLEDLLAACRRYPLPPRRRLTFEYVLLAGVNDEEQDARRLATLLRGLRCKINLIPFNEFPGSPFRRPPEAQVIRFQSVLRNAGFDVFVRASKGGDVLGACGQLGQLTPPLRRASMTPPAVTC